MNRQKVDYGIDLGTTNSSIARMDKGVPTIIKDDIRQKDITPSCIAFNRKKTIFSGEDAFNLYNRETLKGFILSESEEKTFQRNSFKEFKRTMGTEEKYHSSFMEKEYTSEELSAELLKTLKSYVKDEDINCAVITVPAKFRQSQIDATQRAAKLAGFDYCELLQEPIAASMAYGLDTKNIDGHWIAFDFGGGTFDSALMKVEEGIMKVIDTEGDNHLGGKNIDNAITDKIIVPWLREKYAINNILQDKEGKRKLREALKQFAERVKIELSAKDKFEIYTDEPIGTDDNGEEIELDLSISLHEFDEAAIPLFQRAIDLCSKLLKENKLSGRDLTTIVLIGGPTQCQTLRKMLAEQITENINTSIYPMTAVTVGAALFASTKDVPEKIRKRDKSKVQLKLKYPETTVETDPKLGIKIDRDKCSGEVPKDVYIEIIRSDKGWTSGKIKIEDDAEIVDLTLNPGKVNNFGVILSDEKGTNLDCEPDNITIISGLKAAKATLPRDVCIDIIDMSSEEAKPVLVAIIEKNKALPAKGKGIFKTQQDIRPGNKDDLINIPIHEGAPGTRPITNEFWETVIITGDDLPQLLPAGSDVEITINIDSSRRGKLEVYFPYIDETVEVDLPENLQKAPKSNELLNEIEKEKNRLHIMEEDGIVDEAKSEETTGQLNEISELIEDAGEDIDTRLQVKERLNEIIQKSDSLESTGKWPNMEERLQDALSKAQTVNDRFGDEKSTELLQQLKEQLNKVLQEKKISVAIHLEEELRAFVFAVQSQHIGFWISMIKGMDDDFDIIDWKDKSAAKSLLIEAKEIIANNPNIEQLRIIAGNLFNQMVNPSQSPLSKIDKTKLTR